MKDTRKRHKRHKKKEKTKKKINLKQSSFFEKKCKK